ncbi:MAG: tetratricopeptide repeat protein [Acidobacteriota bacterium]
MAPHVYLTLGDKDRALEALERAFEIKSGITTGISADSRLKELHKDPRFSALLRRMGIPL